MGESFVPVCLPGFDASAFVHAYVGCLDEAGSVFVALLTGAPDAFHRLAGDPAGLVSWGVHRRSCCCVLHTAMTLCMHAKRPCVLSE